LSASNRCNARRTGSREVWKISAMLLSRRTNPRGKRPSEMFRRSVSATILWRRCEIRPGCTLAVFLKVLLPECGLSTVAILRSIGAQRGCRRAVIQKMTVVY